MNPTHDWHIGTDGMELLIVRDEVDTVGVHLGPDGIDTARESEDLGRTEILTSRLLEMIDTVHPDAIAAYRAERDALTARVTAIATLRTWATGVEEQLDATAAEGIDLGEWAVGLRSGIRQAREAADKIDQETTR